MYLNIGVRNFPHLQRFKLLPYIYLLCFLILPATSNPIQAEDIQLMLPDMNVSSRPVIEFRARKAHGDIDISVSPPHIGLDASPGHAYVLLGRELDNGLTVYNAVAGFYPKTSGGINMVRQLVVTPGVVKQTLDDAKSEITFKIYITPIQEQKIAAKIEEYNSKDYNLAIQNCVSMTRDVAQIVGLKIPKLRHDLRNVFPQVFMVQLRNLNKSSETAAQPAPTVSTPSIPSTAINPSVGSHAVDAVMQGKAGAPVVPTVPVLSNPAFEPALDLPNLPLPPDAPPAVPASLPPPPVSVPVPPPP